MRIEIDDTIIFYGKEYWVSSINHAGGSFTLMATDGSQELLFLSELDSHIQRGSLLLMDETVKDMTKLWDLPEDKKGSDKDSEVKEECTFETHSKPPVFKKCPNCFNGQLEALFNATLYCNKCNYKE